MEKLFKTSKNPYKRSEIIFVKDDDGHDYCIHQSEEDDFNRWEELTGKWWNDDRDYETTTMGEFLKENGYIGRDYEDFMIGTSPNNYLKTTEFMPEN